MKEDRYSGAITKGQAKVCKNARASKLHQRVSLRGRPVVDLVETSYRIVVEDKECASFLASVGLGSKIRVVPGEGEK